MGCWGCWDDYYSWLWIIPENSLLKTSKVIICYQKTGMRRTDLWPWTYQELIATEISWAEVWMKVDGITLTKTSVAARRDKSRMFERCGLLVIINIYTVFLTIHTGENLQHVRIISGGNHMDFPWKRSQRCCFQVLHINPCRIIL